MTIGYGTGLLYGAGDPFLIHPSNILALAPGSTTQGAFQTATKLVYNRSTVGAAGLVYAQTSPNALQVVPAGVDIPSVENVSGTLAGLCFEMDSANDISGNPRILSTWNGQPPLNATQVQPCLGEAGPDGSFLSNLVNVTAANGYSSYHLGGAGAFSAWLKTPAGAPNPLQILYSNGGALTSALGGTSAVWQRYVLTQPIQPTVMVGVPVSGEDRIAWGGIAAGLRDCLVDFCQQERYAFPTIVKGSGNGAARDRDRIYYPYGSTTWIDTDGSINMWLQMTMKHGSGPGEGPPFGQTLEYLWSFATGLNVAPVDFARIDLTTLKLEIASNSISLFSTNSITFARGDVIEFFTQSGAVATVAKYRKNGVVFDWAMTATPLPAYSSIVGANLNLLGVHDAAPNAPLLQLPCWLSNSAAYKTGKRPSWAY